MDFRIVMEIVGALFCLATGFGIGVPVVLNSPVFFKKLIAKIPEFMAAAKKDLAKAQEEVLDAQKRMEFLARVEETLKSLGR